MHSTRFCGSIMMHEPNSVGPPASLEATLKYFFAPLRSSGDRPPLFCIFPGPPGARDLADCLPEDQPVYEFYSFAKADGASSFPTVEQLAAAYLEDIRRVQPRGPRQLCGYSKGGLIAYEMARLLLNQNEDVSMLVLFGTRHPAFTQNLTTKEMAKFKILYIVNRLGKYARNLVRLRFDRVAADALELLLKRSKMVGWRTIRPFFRAVNRPVPKSMRGAETNVSLWAYNPQPYSKRFVVLRPRDFVLDKLNDQTLGWHACATGGVDIYLVPGDHSTMIYKPHVRGLVDIIKPMLAGAQLP